MKIGFNAYFLNGLRSGIGRYSYNILAGLRSGAPVDRYSLYENKLKLNKLVFEQIFLPLELWLDRPKIFFSPSIILPYFSFTPSILIVYDLVFDLFPEFYRGWINQVYLRVFFPRSLRKARAIIAISESTKKDLMRLYKVPEAKITVIHLAATETYKAMLEERTLKRVKHKYSLPDNYLLFVGTVEPRKNVRGLLQAYLSLPGLIRGKYHLIICGQKGWGYDSLQQWLAEQPERDGVVFLDYVEEADLPAIYNMAALFIYPSFYEGFGLPVLEAMACGVPTITSKVSSLPEVAGEAAILIEPNDSQQISAAMAKVLGDQGYADELRRKGLMRAKLFSWEKVAKQTLRVMQEVAG